VKVVIDTNVLLVSISSRSPMHWVWKSLLAQKFTLCVTTEILAEYEEIIGEHMGFEAAEYTISTIINLKNAELATTWYRFLLLADADDDKYVDCCVATNADFIVSHDKGFKSLKKIPFPKVVVIDSVAFKKRLGL
jgi:uncharacterized protein